MPSWVWLVSLFVVIGILYAAVRVLERTKDRPKELGGSSEGGSTGPSPFVLRPQLLTNAEREFFNALLVACAGQVHVLAKVRLFDVLDIAPATPSRQIWQNRVQSKHLDFVLCDRLTCRPLAAIELDDASHGRAPRVARDAQVDRYCSDAGFLLVRIPVTRTFDHASIRTRLIGVLEPPGASSTGSGRSLSSA